MAEMWKPQSIEIYLAWVQAIRDEAEESLTSWERDFIDSLEGRLVFGSNLSEKQAGILERIYTEKTK